ACPRGRSGFHHAREVIFSREYHMRKFPSALWATVSLIAMTAGLAPASAAPAAAEGETAGAIQEIVVTAQRREQSLQDVGISIAAYSGDLLRESGVDSSTDIARMTPGLHLSGSAG